MSSLSLDSARSESRYSTASSASLSSLLRLHPHLQNDGSSIQTGAVRSLIRRFEGLGGPAGEATADDPEGLLSASTFTDVTQRSEPTESTASLTLSTESRGLEFGPSPPPSYFFIGPPDESTDDDADIDSSQGSPLSFAGAMAVAGPPQPSLLSLLEVSEDDDGPDHRLLRPPQRSAPETPEPLSPTSSSVKDLWVPIPSPQPLFPRRASRAGRLARFLARTLTRRAKPAKSLKARRVEAGCQTDVETAESSAQTPPTHQAVCTVCLATFQEAVVLGCGHSFCRGCVGGLVETRWRAEGRQSVSCPTCRAVHHGPKGLLHRLPPNYALKDLTGP